MEFKLQAKTPLYNVWQRQKCCTANVQQVFVWQKMRYILYGQDLTRHNIFENGILAEKMATTEIFRNMGRLCVHFVIINFKLWIC